MGKVPPDWVALNKRDSLPRRISKIKGTVGTWSLWHSKWNPSLPLPACRGGHPPLPTLLHYSHPCYDIIWRSFSLCLCHCVWISLFLYGHQSYWTKSPLYSSMSPDELITSSHALRCWGLGLEHTILGDRLICNSNRETKKKHSVTVEGSRRVQLNIYFHSRKEN